MPKGKTNSKDNKMIGYISALVLILIALCLWWAYSFSTTMVKDELKAQKIFFPQKGSASFSPEVYPDLQKYAGMQVDDGVKAKAYANGYIGRHLDKVADGKTYAEVSAESMAKPDDEKLKGQKQTLFMGETLRGLLLNAYAFWTIGVLLKLASLVVFVAGLSLLLFVKLKK